MTEILRRIGRELQRRYAYMLTMPMNWRMIDAFVRLEEAEEQREQKRVDGAHQRAEKVEPKPNVVSISQQNESDT